MKYRRLDADGDMMGIRVKDFHLEGADAVGAAIRSRLLSFQGEWWEDEEEGVPFEALIGRMDEEREQVADALIRERIMGTEGVVSIDDYRVDVEGRTRTVYVEVLTEFGETLVEVSL